MRMRISEVGKERVKLEAQTLLVEKLRHSQQDGERDLDRERAVSQNAVARLREEFSEVQKRLKQEIEVRAAEARNAELRHKEDISALDLKHRQEMEAHVTFAQETAVRHRRDASALELLHKQELEAQNASAQASVLKHKEEILARLQEAERAEERSRIVVDAGRRHAETMDEEDRKRTAAWVQDKNAILERCKAEVKFRKCLSES